MIVEELKKALPIIKVFTITLSITCLFLLVACSTQKYGPEYEEANNYTVNWIKINYGEDISLENPKESGFGIDGSGKYEDINDKSKDAYYVNCLWNEIKFTEYTERKSDSTLYVYKDCFQSVKYSYDLENVLQGYLDDKFVVDIPYYNWEPEGSTIYTNYIDYFNNIETKDCPTVNIEITAEDKDYKADIKQDLLEISKVLPEELEGNFILKGNHEDNYYTVTIPYSKNTIDFKKAAIDGYSKNSHLSAIFR